MEDDRYAARVEFPYPVESGPVRIARGEFGVTKFRDFPSVQGSAEQPTGLQLKDDEGLRFPSHFAWWDLTHLSPAPSVPKPDPCGVLLWEHNQAAPRIATMASYLNMLFYGQLYIHFEPLIDADVWDELVERAPHVAAVKVEVAKPAMPTGLSALFGQAPSKSEIAKIEFRRGRRKRFETSEILADLARLREMSEVERLRVETQAGWILDLLADSQAMKTRIDVPLSTEIHRAVDSKALYIRLNELFRESRGTIAARLGRRWVDES